MQAAQSDADYFKDLERKTLTDFWVGPLLGELLPLDAKRSIEVLLVYFICFLLVLEEIFHSDKTDRKIERYAAELKDQA